MTQSIYLYHAEEGEYESYLIDDESDDDTLRFLTGNPLAGDWTGAKISLANRGTEHSDFPSFIGATPLFSANAWKALASHLDGIVEALPVIGNGKRVYYAINVLEIYDDVFDTDRSKFAFNTYSKSISTVYQYYFKNLDKIRSPLFKTRETLWIDTYFTDVFLDLISGVGLKGLKGIPIFP